MKEKPRKIEKIKLENKESQILLQELENIYEFQKAILAIVENFGGLREFSTLLQTKGVVYIEPHIIAEWISGARIPTYHKINRLGVVLSSLIYGSQDTDKSERDFPVDKVLDRLLFLAGFSTANYNKRRFIHMIEELDDEEQPYTLEVGYLTDAFTSHSISGPDGQYILLLQRALKIMSYRKVRPIYVRYRSKEDLYSRLINIDRHGLPIISGFIPVDHILHLDYINIEQIGDVYYGFGISSSQTDFIRIMKMAFAIVDKLKD